MRISIDKIAEGAGYIMWYGAWILGGITLGLLLHPSLAGAYEIVADDFETYSLGNLAPQGGWSTSSASAIVQVVGTTYGVAPDSGSQMMQVGDVNRYVNFPTATSTYSGEDQQTLSFMWYAYDYTTGTNAPAINMSWRFYSAGHVLQQTLYTCAYPTSGTVATFRISSGSNCNSGTITSVKTNMPQGYWATVACTYDKSANTFGCSIDGETQVNYSVALDVDNAYTKPEALQGYTYGEGFLDYFGWSSVQGPSLPSGESGSMVFNGVPANWTYGNASTSAVKTDVYLTTEDYEKYSDFYVETTCYYSPYEPVWGFYDPGQAGIFEYFDFGNIKDYCSASSTCTLTHDIPLLDDKRYDCTATLQSDELFWFSTELDFYSWSFYTFESSSSPEAIAYNASLVDSLTNWNLTGTTTPGENPEDEPFGYCKWGEWSVYNCIILPIKYMVVPTETQSARTAQKLHESVFQYFPFSIVTETSSIFKSAVSSSTGSTTVVTEFPDISLDVENTSGGTTTLTVLSGSSFTQTWGQLEVLEDFRYILRALLYVTFVLLILGRVRRLIPQAEAIKTV